MASERVGVYPGTFDPVTSGHMEVVRRSLRLVDKLVIGPATNIGKGPLFSLQERIDIIKDDIADFSATDKARIQIAQLRERGRREGFRVLVLCVPYREGPRGVYAWIEPAENQGSWFFDPSQDHV